MRLCMCALCMDMVRFIQNLLGLLFLYLNKYIHVEA